MVPVSAGRVRGLRPASPPPDEARDEGCDTVQKGPDQNLDRFVGCEKFVG
jgi:hypothetical protein